MPTFESLIRDHQPLIRVQTPLPNTNNNAARLFAALLDTGAQFTSVSPKVQQEMGLEPVGVGSMIPANGEVISTPKFHVRIDIPVATNVHVQGGAQYQTAILQGMERDILPLPFEPHNFEILLGMDFIAGFHITLSNGRFILSN